MNKFGILLKTFAGDIEYAQRFVASYNKYNVDNIPLYIVAPRDDIGLFIPLVSKNIELIDEESVTDSLVTEAVGGIRPGYVNQEIIKLAFWETERCENYLCADSDGEFIRDFHVSDFMYDDDTPYSVLVEDNELMVEPEYYAIHWQGRLEWIRRIQSLIGMDSDRRVLTCHGFAVLSSRVLRSLKTKYMDQKSQTYLDLIRASPYEFSWYNMWLQHDRTIEIHAREHLFKYFHHKNQHLEYRIKGVTLADLARGYVGVVINSNYSRGFGLMSFDANRAALAANYFSKSELLLALAYKLKRKVPLMNKTRPE
jgi:hypothetical protein